FLARNIRKCATRTGNIAMRKRIAFWLIRIPKPRLARWESRLRACRGKKERARDDRDSWRRAARIHAGACGLPAGAALSFSRSFAGSSGGAHRYADHGTIQRPLRFEKICGWPGAGDLRI